MLTSGIVIVGYGTGNVSEPMYYAIQKAIKNGLKVVLVTNCKIDIFHFYLNLELLCS